MALTQIAVEVVTTVLLLLGLRWMPRRLEFDELRRHTWKARARRARDMAVAVAVGGGVAMLAYAIITRPPIQVLSPFFVERSLAEAGGRNVVNVILVDFRGFDTLGEITVIAVVALSVYALLRRFRPATESRDRPRAQREDAAREALEAGDGLPSGYLRIPATFARMLLPMAGLLSFYFLLRGHNAPGGGFVGGLVMATAIIVQYMTSGVLWVESRLQVHPQYWIAIGLLSAGVAGIVAWFAAQAVSHEHRMASAPAAARRTALVDGAAVRSWRVHGGRRRHGADAHRAWASIAAAAAQDAARRRNGD